MTKVTEQPPRNLSQLTRAGINNSQRFANSYGREYRLRLSFINFPHHRGRVGETKRDLYSRIAELLYLTRCVWRMHFSARRTVCKVPRAFAREYTTRSREEISHVRIGRRRFSAPGGKYIITSAGIYRPSLMEF